jgi:KaiC/GvpD/RAD55 family RecA-like ATPase
VHPHLDRTVPGKIGIQRRYRQVGAIPNVVQSLHPVRLQKGDFPRRQREIDGRVALQLDQAFLVGGIEGPVIRKKLQEFFFKLRTRGVTTFIILETQMVDDRPEYFLVDGIIEMGTDKLGNDIKRYMVVRKMRATRHEMKPFLLEAGGDGIKIIGELF